VSVSTPRIYANVPTARPREDWVDVAKGIAIILVVLFHAIIFTDDVGLAWHWRKFTDLLDTFRMPLFFFTAGVFAAKVIRLPFPVLFRRRIASLLWIYVFWSFIWTVAFKYITWVRPDADRNGWYSFLTIPFWPNANTWFVYALALFFVYTWLVRSWAVHWQFVLPMILNLAFGSGLVSSGNGAIDKSAMYLLFFVAAVHFGPVVRLLTVRTKLSVVVLISVAYVAAVVAIRLSDTANLPGTRLIASVLAVATGTGLAVVISRLRASGWLRYLGRNTLPVYVLHFYPIFGFVLLGQSFKTQIAPFSGIFPLMTCAAAIVISLLVFKLTRGVPGLYGFVLPANGEEGAATKKYPQVDPNRFLIQLESPRFDRPTTLVAVIASCACLIAVLYVGRQLLFS
jgi:uncharacterized membrane protein YcfT